MVIRSTFKNVNPRSVRDGCINVHNIKIGKVEECDGIGSSCLDALN